MQIGRWMGILISLALLGSVLHSFNLREAGRVLQSANYIYLLPVCYLLVNNFAVRAFLGSSILGAICMALSGQSLMQVRKQSYHLAEE